MPIFDGILVRGMTYEIARIAVIDSFWNVQYGKHIILKAEPTNIFQVSLPGKSLSSNFKRCSIFACDDAADIIRQKLWFNCFNNFIMCLLFSNRIIPSFILEKDDLGGLQLAGFATGKINFQTCL